jgi:tetratricopeptide (TPR) repeat protein
MASYDRAIALDPTAAHLFVERGDLRLLAEDPVGALADFDAALKIEPNRVDALNSRGRYFLDVDAPQKALADFDAAAAIDADNVEVAGNRALALMKLGRHEAALKEADRAIKISPEAFGYGVKAAIHADMGDHRLAVSALDEAIRLDADDPLAWWGRGEAKAKLGDAAGAAADKAQARKLDPRIAD